MTTEHRYGPKTPPRTIPLGEGRVTINRVDPQSYPYHDEWGSGRLDNRSRFAVRVDGVLRGHVAFPTGYGQRWQAWSLGTTSRRHAAVDVVNPQKLSDNKDALLRDALALQFVGWVEEGLAPTREEIDAAHAERSADEAQSAAEAERRRVIADAAALQSRIEEAIKHEEGALARRDSIARALDALTSIRTRLAATLTDAERVGLDDALGIVAAARDSA